MPFLPNIPQPNDQLSVSQGNLLNNFQILGAIAGNANPNSALINAAAGFNFVYMPVQAAQPNFVATSSNVWTQLNNIAALGNTGQRELFVRTDTANTPANQGIPITSAVKAARGYTFLPSGIILQWGQTNVLALGANPNAATGNFALTFPTACLNVQISPQGNGVVDQNTAMYVYTLTTTNFNVWLSVRDTAAGGVNAPLFAYYFAIGF